MPDVPQVSLSAELQSSNQAELQIPGLEQLSFLFCVSVVFHGHLHVFRRESNSLPFYAPGLESKNIPTFPLPSEFKTDELIPNSLETSVSREESCSTLPIQGLMDLVQTKQGGTAVPWTGLPHTWLESPVHRQGFGKRNTAELLGSTYSPVTDRTPCFGGHGL